MLAELLERGQAYDQALERYRLVIRLLPTSDRARLGEASVLAHQGKLSAAKARLGEAQELLPDSGLLARALARVLAASPDPTLRDGERALQLAERIFQAQNSPEHAELLALALAELGRCSEAAALTAQIVEALRGLQASLGETPTAAEEAAVGQLGRFEGLQRRFGAGPPCDAPSETTGAPAATNP
jgi:tetratricopeptide (TPR) repeat protein